MDYVFPFKEESSTYRSISTSSISNSVVDDTSPDSVMGKKSMCTSLIYFNLSTSAPLCIHFLTLPVSSAPPRFLHISSTPQPERNMALQRRHSIEKETPTSVRPFVPPSRQSSRSLVCWYKHYLPFFQRRLFIEQTRVQEAGFSCQYIHLSATLIATPGPGAVIQSANHMAVMHKYHADTGQELKLIFPSNIRMGGKKMWPQSL